MSAYHLPAQPVDATDVDKLETTRRSSYRGVRLGYGRQGADHHEQFLEVDLELRAAVSMGYAGGKPTRTKCFR